MFLKISKFFFYASLFAVVVVASTTFFPFIGGKYYFFRTMVELASVGLLLWWAFEANPGELERRFARVASRPIFRAVSTFAFAFLLACFFADDSQAAFWSNFERGEGGFQMIHYYLFFALSTIIFDKREEWMRVFQVSLVAGVMMIMYGVFATMGIQGFIAPSFPEGNLFERLFSDSRFQGSLGNPAYVAPYLLFSVFYGLYLWASQKNNRSLYLKVGYVALTLFLLTFFILSGTRGGFLGLIAGVGIFLAYMIFRAEPNVKKRAVGGLVICLILGGLLYVFRAPLIARDVPGSRFLSISFSADSAQTRIWTWNSAWQGFKERPLFGWGPENFSTVFDKYFDPRHFVPGQNTETWFDRAHSVVLDYLVETGLFGLLAYLGMFGALAYELFRASPRKGDNTSVRSDDTWRGVRESLVLQGLCVALPVAYFAQAIILFDVLPIYINLFLFLGFMTFEFSQPHAER
jgi:O-antigen ligase